MLIGRKNKLKVWSLWLDTVCFVIVTVSQTKNVFQSTSGILWFRWHFNKRCIQWVIWSTVSTTLSEAWTGWCYLWSLILEISVMKRLYMWVRMLKEYTSHFIHEALKRDGFTSHPPKCFNKIVSIYYVGESGLTKESFSTINNSFYRSCNA